MGKDGGVKDGDPSCQNGGVLLWRQPRRGADLWTSGRGAQGRYAGSAYAELANAIVLQAFKDYRKTLFKLVQEPEEWKHRSSKKKLERFFHSKWYRTLTDLDPAILMQEAKRQADINVERWERGRARARERAERKAAKKNLSAAAVM